MPMKALLSETVELVVFRGIRSGVVAFIISCSSHMKCLTSERSCLPSCWQFLTAVLEYLHVFQSLQALLCWLWEHKAVSALRQETSRAGNEEKND